MMDKFLLVLSHLMILSLIALIAYLIGRKLTQTIPYHSKYEQISFCLALGLGTIAYIIALLGFLRILYLEVVLLACIGILIVTFDIWFELLWTVVQLRRTKLRVDALAILVTVSVLFSISLLCFYPPRAFDSTMYHLPIAQENARHHALPFNPFIRHAAFPLLMEMLFTLALLISDERLAHLMGFLTMIVAGCGLLAWGFRYRSMQTGVLAALVFVSNPIIIRLGLIALVDLGVALFVFMSFYALSTWMATRARAWLILSAPLWGFACGTKYLALPLAFLFAAIALILSLQRRALRDFLLFIFIGVGVASPWYIRNIYHTGNPFFPYLASVFGYGLYDAGDTALGFRAISGLGFGKSFGSLLALPYRLVFASDRFHFGLWEGMKFSPIMLIGFSHVVPLLVLIWHKRVAKIIALALAVSLAFTLFWFCFLEQELRYLMAVIPFYSLITVVTLESLWPRLCVRVYKSSVVLMMICGLTLYPAFQSLAQEIRVVGFPPPLSGSESARFLTKHHPTYPAYQHLNQINQNKKVSLYAFMDEDMFYFFEGAFMGDWVGPARYRPILRNLYRPDKIYDYLKDLKADYFLISFKPYWSQLERIDPVFRDSPFDWVNNIMSSHHFLLEYALPSVYVFKVMDAERPDYKFSANLLINAEFEIIQDGKIANWDAHPRYLIHESAAGCYSGKTCVAATRASYLTQRVRIRQPGIYKLSHYTKSLKPNSYARLQINWLDAAAEHLLRADIRLVKAAEIWKYNELFVLASPDARFADVYLSVHDDAHSEVLFDSMEFRYIYNGHK